MDATAERKSGQSDFELLEPEDHLVFLKLVKH